MKFTEPPAATSEGELLSPIGLWPLARPHRGWLGAGAIVSPPPRLAQHGVLRSTEHRETGRAGGGAGAGEIERCFWPEELAGPPGLTVRGLTAFIPSRGWEEGEVEHRRPVFSWTVRAVLKHVCKSLSTAVLRLGLASASWIEAGLSGSLQQSTAEVTAWLPRLVLKKG